MEPDSIVLTASAARRYFGDSDPLGQLLILEEGLPMRVAGVIEDLPQNTHLRFDMLVPMEMATTVFTTNALDNWTWRNYHTYVLLAEGSDIVSGMMVEHVHTRRQVDDCINLSALPGFRLRCQLRQRVNSFPFDGWGQIRGLRRAPRYGDDLVTGACEMANQMCPDETGRPGYQNPHCFSSSACHTVLPSPRTTFSRTWIMRVA